MTKQNKQEMIDIPSVFVGISIGILIGGIIIGCSIKWDWNDTLKNNGLMEISSCNSSIQNATDIGFHNGYTLRNEEQLKEILDYNMTYVFGFSNNQVYSLKLVPSGEWELVK